MGGIINFYDELGLDRDSTIAKIQEDLANLKLQLKNKVSRPSSQQDKWKQQLELVDQAEEIFTDEDSRDRYNIDLGRVETTTESETQTVDWTTRAWNYYFIEDFGAALIAARKAREQAPNEPMPFVVSARIQFHDNELKQAKQYADEAFVLDELTTDSVDVQMIRGIVYAALKDYDRALLSFDRALAKASDGEKPEIYWHRALAYASMGDHTNAYESGVAGLSIDVEVKRSIHDNLDKATSDAINHRDNSSNSKQAIKQYQSRKDKINSSAICHSSKVRIVDNIDANIERCEKNIAIDNKRARLVKDREEASAVQPPSGSIPSIPWIAIGAAVVCFFIMIGAFSTSSGAGVVFLLITAVFVIYAGVKGSKRSQYTQAQEEYRRAQSRLEEINQAIYGLKAPDPHAILLKI